MFTKIAIIGTGLISREHVAALKRIKGAEISYVVSRDQGRAKEAARLAGCAWTTDLTEVLTSKEIDAVDICQRNPEHAPLVIAAAQHGKHILVEKPVALNLADFDAMVAATQENKVSFMVGQTLRFQPVHAEFKRAISEGKIGQLRLLHSSRYAGYLWPQGWRAWQLDENLSGGHLRHNGGHPLDLAIWLMGRKPVRVFARTFRSWASGMPVPDSFHITLRFEDGSLALLEFSYALREKGDSYIRMLAVGDKGSLLHNSETEAGLSGSSTYNASPAVEDAMFHELSHWVQTLQGQAEPLVKHSEVRTTLLAALGAHQSLATGKPVTIGDTTNE